MSFLKALFKPQDERPVSIKWLIPVIILRLIVIIPAAKLAYNYLVRGFSSGTLCTGGDGFSYMDITLGSDWLGAYYGNSPMIALLVAVLMISGLITLLIGWKWAHLVALANDVLVIGIFGYDVTRSYYIYYLAPMSALLLWPYLLDALCISAFFPVRVIKRFAAAAVIMLLVGIIAAPLYYRLQVNQISHPLFQAYERIRLPFLHPEDWSLSIWQPADTKGPHGERYMYQFDRRSTDEQVTVYVNIGSKGSRFESFNARTKYWPMLSWNIPYDFPQTHEQAIRLVRRYEYGDSSINKYHLTGSNKKDGIVVQWRFKGGFGDVLTIEPQQYNDDCQLTLLEEESGKTAAR